MSKVYVLSNDNDIITVVTSKRVAETYAKTDLYTAFDEVELDSPEFLNKIAKESPPYKGGAILIPCSACSGGDPRMEFHDHEQVSRKDRITTESENDNAKS